jgi:hypothetical protein
MGGSRRDCGQRHPDGVLSCATKHLSRDSALGSRTSTNSPPKALSVACYRTGHILENAFLRQKVARDIVHHQLRFAEERIKNLTKQLDQMHKAFDLDLRWQEYL